MFAFTRLLAFSTCVASAFSAAIPSNSSSLPWANLAISAPKNGRYLYRTISKDPFFWVADTNWELFHRLNKTDVDLYLADRAAKGFNIITAVLLSKYNVTEIPNFYGDLAIDNEDPTQPNENYFAYVDWIVERAADYGILIAFVPVWGRYVSAAWYGEIEPRRMFTVESAYTFGQYLGNRYPGIPKILGGDSNGFWAGNVPQARQQYRDDPSLDPASLLWPIEDWRPVWSSMMKGWQDAEAAKGWEAFTSFQPTSPWISTYGQPLPYGHNYINGSFGTLSMDGVQSGHENPDPEGIDAGFDVIKPWDSTKNYESITRMRAEFPGPVIDLENHYEGAHDSFNTSKPIWSTAEVRHGLYSAVLNGACGFVYGSLPVQQSYTRRDLVASPEYWIEPQLGLGENETWHEGIHLPGAKQSGYVAKLFAGLTRDEFNSMQPDRSFIGTADGGEDVLKFESNRYVAALVTKGYYWVYAGYGDSFSLDLGALAEHWGAPGTQITAEWFSPRDASLTSITGKDGIRAEGEMSFDAPSRGSVEHDWVLMVREVREHCH